MYMKWAGFITYLSAQRTLKPMDWLRTFRNHSAKCDTLPTLRERMPNKRCTNSCDTTGQHHTQPLAKPQLNPCLTTTTQCSLQSYRSQYTTPKYANKMHKLKGSKRLARIPKQMLSTTLYRSMTKSCCFSVSPRPSQGMTQPHSKL